MAIPRHLDKAPITEALIDFRVSLPESFEADSLERAGQTIVREYPIKQTQRYVMGKLEFGEDFRSQVESEGFRGYVYRNREENQVVQFRVDGFTFSRLSPYTSWEDIFPSALRLWSIYMKFCSPEFITRLAVRYINQINPFPDDTELSELLITAPNIPEGAPPYFSSFLTRIVIHDPEKDLTANHVQTLIPEVNGEYATLILDIDAYKNFERLEPDDEATIREVFVSLRSFRTNLFFGSFTDKMIQEFE